MCPRRRLGEESNPGVGFRGSVTRWLVKEEPDHFSFDDLVRENGTDWNGVHNALALRHLKAMRPAEQVLYYHSGRVRACVGVARVGTVPRPDPSDARGSWTVRLEPVRSLDRPVSLTEIRAAAPTEGFALVRMPRLSVMPVPAAAWSWILAASRGRGR